MDLIFVTNIRYDFCDRVDGESPKHIYIYIYDTTVKNDMVIVTHMPCTLKLIREKSYAAETWWRQHFLFRFLILMTSQFMVSLWFSPLCKHFNPKGTGGGWGLGSFILKTSYLHAKRRNSLVHAAIFPTFSCSWHHNPWKRHHYPVVNLWRHWQGDDKISYKK